MITQRYSIAEFEQFMRQPENQQRCFEYIGGEIVEVPLNPYVSAIAQRISFFIQLFMREHGVDGYVTGEAGGYRVMGERYAPDVAFSHRAGRSLVREGYQPEPPDLAVEVISDGRNSAEQAQLRVKITNYLTAGVVVWVVNPEQRLFEVHQSGQPVMIYTEAMTLEDQTVLPGFRLVIREVFPQD